VFVERYSHKGGVIITKRQEVYLFCKDLWKDLIDKDNGYMYEKHDEEVLTRASNKFTLSKEEVNSIFQEPATLEAKISVSEMNQNKI